MDRPSGRSRSIWPPVIVLLIGLLGTGAVDHWVSKSLDKQTRALIDAHHAQFTDLVQQSINMRLQALDVLARTLAGADHPDDVFQRQASGLLRRMPDIVNVDRIVRISDAQRELVEQQLSQRSGQFITLGQWQESGSVSTAARQDQYWVVMQAAQRQGVAASLGLVAPSVPHWRQPIDTALSHDKVSATAQTHLRRNGTSEFAVRLFRSLDDGSLVSLAFSPDQLLREALPARMSPALQVTVFDLDQHLKSPLFATDRLEQPRMAWALRSAISLADREWILTTIPDKHFMSAPAERIGQIIWLVGLAASLLAAIVIWLLAQRLNREQIAHATAQRLLDAENQMLENARIEKSALKNALQDSEQRSRDLVEIAGSTTAELDEQGRIGFISAQVVDLLGVPPARLHNRSLRDLVAANDRTRYDQCLSAARTEKRVERIDLNLHLDEQSPVPATLRIKPVVDTLTGCSGFRLSLQARSATTVPAD